MSLKNFIYLRHDAMLLHGCRRNGESSSSIYLAHYKENGLVHPENLTPSPSVTAINAYLNEHKSSLGSPETFMTFPAEVINQEIIFYVEFKEEFVKKLCDILPDPLVQIQGDYKPFLANRSAIEGPKVEERFRLQEMLEAAEANDREKLRHRLGTLPEVAGERPNNVNVSCVMFRFNVLIGWAEPDEIEIKVNTDTFMQQLFERDASKDFTFVTGDGAEVKCHRIVFEVHSAVLDAMVSSNNGMMESQTGRVELPENTKTGVEHLVRYFYGIPLDANELPCDIAVELLKTAHKYELQLMQEGMEKLFLQKGKDWFTPDDLLELYFHVKNLDCFVGIRDKCLRIMASMPHELKICERYKDLNRAEFEQLFWNAANLLTDSEMLLQIKKRKL